MSNNKKKFQYHFADGSTSIEIKIGENGVSKDVFEIVVEMDRKEKEKEKYNNEKSAQFDDLLENTLGSCDGSVADEEEPECNHMEELLRSCVDRLSPKQQELYYAIMGMKMTYEAVAKRKGIAASSVYGQMETIKRNLRKMLEESE